MSRVVRSDNLSKKHQATVEVVCVDTDRRAQAHVLDHTPKTLVLAMNTVKITLHRHPKFPGVYIGNLEGMTFECHMPE